MSHFGPVEGYPVGSLFENRRAASAAGVHRPTRAGICGTADEGAESIVLSGGYEDDQDWGATILYTGQGGRDPDTGRQAQHQRLNNRGNRALATSAASGRPVRVLRKTEAGYRYDGLYRVVRFWEERGLSGLFVWRFELKKEVEDVERGT